MGFDEGRMVLDSPNGTYYSGQPVHGTLIFHQDKVKIFRGIFVKLKGFCHVHWTTTRSRTVNGKSQSYTVHHNAHEEYINDKTYLVGGESGEVSIGPGDYEYSFHFRLPENCPASFEGDYGHIRYEIKAVVDRAFKFDQEKKIAVRVMAPMNLNLDPYCKEPIEMLFEEAYCCCCMSSGVCNALVKLPVGGYCPGQTIPIDLVVSNKGGVEINDIKLCITKKLTFIATSEPGRKKCKDTVVEIKKGSIPGNTNRTWTLEMEVPAMDVYNLTGCQYITLEYAFKVVINPSGCHSDSKESRRLVLGTIPLVGFQDNVQNPLHDQLPQPIPQPPMAAYPPVINAYPEGNPPQPLNPPFPQPQPYPGNSPYPNDNQKHPPYPQTNSPYPPTSSPYPPTSSPYPPTNSPYPPTSSPYPPTSSPYPPTSSPYPPNSSSYPSANPPYPNVTPYRDNPPPYPGNLTNPGSNPPYPVENSPYSTEKSPFLIGNSPNPGANPPYPVTNSPYPPQNVQYQTTSNPNPGGIGGLKTGNLGFAVPSGGTGMNLPSFPPNNSSPSPRPAPYATASAPAPDSPDVLPEKKD